MKKTLSVLLALVMCLTLCACGKSGTEKADHTNKDSAPVVNVGDITIDDLIGTWHSVDTKQVMLVNANNVWLFQHPINTTESPMPPKVEKKQLVIFGFGTFDIETNNGQLKIVCTATEMIAKDTSFVKCEEIVSLDEIAAHSWVNPGTGATLTFANGSYTHTTSNGSSMEAETQWSFLAGDTYYMPNVDIFKIVVEGDTFKLIGETLGEYVTQEDADAQTKSEIVNLAMGETASTEFAEFTLSEIEYADRLNTSTGSGVLTRDHGLTDAGLVVGNNIFAILHYDFTNLAKEKINIVDVVTVTVDYNNGYLYSTDDGLAYTFDSTGFYNNYSGDGYNLELAPLEADNYKVCIPVAPVIGEDETSPLQIIVKLQGEGGEQTFRYTIR